MSFAFFFPGQGSQSLHMMDGFDGVSVVKNTFDEASAALGQDLWAMMNGEDSDLIGQTVNTQPLMLAAGVATYRAYLEAGGKAATCRKSWPDTAWANTARWWLPKHWPLPMRSNSSACVRN